MQPASVPSSLVGPYAPNQRLVGADRWELGAVGPEDVTVAPDGSVFTGVEDGRILRFGPGGSSPETVARTGGRPNGIEVDRDWSLVVCDIHRGLLRVSLDGQVVVLVDEVDGIPLTYANNGHIAADGRIFFSDSSTYGARNEAAALLDSNGTGRLFVHDPTSGATEVLLDGLHFANGVVVLPDGSAVLVAETTRSRITRLWLTGLRAGETDLFAEHLPGGPDNLSLGTDGSVWVAIPAVSDAAESAAFANATADQIRALIEETVRDRSRIRRYGLVLRFGPDGELRESLHDPGGAYATISGVREQGGWLYLGSLVESSVGRVRL